MYYHQTLNSFIDRGVKFNWFDRYIVLQPDNLKADVQQFEREFAAPFPKPLIHVLEHWTAGNSSLLLETLPILLNPTVPLEDLTPTGHPMAELLPEFYQWIGTAEEFVIIAYVGKETETPIEYLLIGLTLMPVRTASSIMWVYYVPQSLEWITKWEIESNIKLSPQMKQMYICCNGNINNYPYFYALEGLYYGALTDVYEPIWDEVDSPEPYERLEKFVVVSTTGSGDDYGFFPDEVNPDGECPFYIWNADFAEFQPYAENFVAFLNEMHS